jgi:hypothetical protein
MWCPECKRNVGIKMTYGQVTFTCILLCCFVLPGIIYLLCHAEKCPICGSLTTDNQPHVAWKQHANEPNHITQSKNTNEFDF